MPIDPKYLRPMSEEALRALQEPDALMPEWLRKRYFEPQVTLRDRFAMAALTGLLSGGDDYADIWREAYWHADAMLQAREGR